MNLDEQWIMERVSLYISPHQYSSFFCQVRAVVQQISGMWLANIDNFIYSERYYKSISMLDVCLEHLKLQ